MKEQEEREVDKQFTTQKELIIDRARKLDKRREEYRIMQQEMIKEVG
jgi:hypothetical protein